LLPGKGEENMSIQDTITFLYNAQTFGALSARVEYDGYDVELPIEEAYTAFTEATMDRFPTLVSISFE
jgi:hypothetical protein